MKYRNIKKGEVIPENAEIYSKYYRKWEPYWDDRTQYIDAIRNFIFKPRYLRAPIEEDN